MELPDFHHTDTARCYARSLMADNRGQSNSVGQGVGVVVTLFMTLLVTVYLVPLAITEINAVSTTGWSSQAAQMWGLLGLMIVLSVVLFMLGFASNSHQRGGR